MLSRLTVVLIALSATSALALAVISQATEPDQAAAVPQPPARAKARPKQFHFQTAGSAEAPEGDSVVERAYDIGPALRKLAEIDPHADARAWLHTYLRLPGLSPTAVRQDQDDAHRLHVTLTEGQHAALAGVLDSIGRAGPWQVMVEARVFRSRHLEALGDVDWQDAVKFAAPQANEPPEWTGAAPTQKASDGLSLSAETVSWEYAPYLALVVDATKMQRLVDRFQRDARSSVLSAPKVTLVSGQQATVRDASQRPFVVGVDYIEGELATAAQPEIVVLSEGTRIDVNPQVIDAETLELNCRLTVSYVDGVSEVTLPGKEITVQNPRASRKTISARARIAQGEAVLLAPFAGKTTEAKGKTMYFAITARWQAAAFTPARE